MSTATKLVGILVQCPNVDGPASLPVIIPRKDYAIGPRTGCRCYVLKCACGEIHKIRVKTASAATMKRLGLR